MRLISPLLAFFLACAALAGIDRAAANPSIVFDVATGKVIAHEDAFQRWYPASLTKLMTAYVTFRALGAGELTLASPITMSKLSASQPPSKMGYKPGQTISLDNALKMLIVKSANDIAMAIGENVAGTQSAFVARMNAEAARLGMTGSHFVNPNGLHSIDQYTTAHDLALLVRAIRLEYPQYASYFRIQALGAGNKVLKTNVDLLGRFTGADGMKTGFICPSGFNLVASATRNDRTLVAVVLGSHNPHVRADQAANLLGKGFEQQVPGPATLATLVPYGEGRDLPRDMRGEICDRPAKSEKLDKVDAKGRPIFTSPYLHERAVPPEIVAVAPGGRRRAGPRGVRGCARVGRRAGHFRGSDTDAAARIPGRRDAAACAAGRQVLSGRRLSGDAGLAHTRFGSHRVSRRRFSRR